MSAVFEHIESLVYVSVPMLLLEIDSLEYFMQANLQQIFYLLCFLFWVRNPNGDLIVPLNLAAKKTLDAPPKNGLP